MDSTASINGMQTRKKRVLPTRSRRGGPGVGSCDVDLMILETHKRRSENEPLIPAESVFLLTTDSDVVDGPSNEVEAEFNIQANERYFDRPEVLKSFREQLLIETPEFVHVVDLPSVGVGGRFRPRGCGENLVDTSDAAYEKRHRKYETFEKRLRLREKEKLKHEHYKLKERIEQLKSMDGSAFLSLPASSFSPVDGHELENSDDGSSHDGHGGNAHYEGERRRKEMLDAALSIEERYRMLLPPRRPNTNSWIEQDNRQSEEKEEPTRLDIDPSPTPRDTSGIKLKIKITSPQTQAVSNPIHPVPIRNPRQVTVPPRPSPLRRATNQHEIEELPQASPPASPIDETVPDPVDKSEAEAEGPAASEAEVEASPQPSVSVLETSAPPVSIPVTPMSNPEIVTLETVVAHQIVREEDELDTPSRGHTPPPREHTPVSPKRSPKRPRLSPSPIHFQEPAEATAEMSLEAISVPSISARQTSVPPIESINAPTSAPLYSRIKQQKQQKPLFLQRANPKPKQPSAGPSNRRDTTGLLMTAAIRSSIGVKSRNTMRSVTAFGVKVPQAIEEHRDFELPGWLSEPPEDEEDDEAEQDSEHGEHAPASDDDRADESDDDPPTDHISFVHSFVHTNAANMIRQMSLGLPYQTSMDTSSGFQGFYPPIDTLDIPESSVRDVP